MVDHFGLRGGVGPTSVRSVHGSSRTARLQEGGLPRVRNDRASFFRRSGVAVT